MEEEKPVICFLCTGNAARSVMARIMFEKRVSNYIAIGAGTLVLEGHPMSQRTRKALERFGISDPTHRSTQFGQKHVGVDLIVAMEPSHIEWIRKNFPEVAQRTATLPRLVRDLTEEGSLTERIMKLDLAEVNIESWEEVLDPASGDQEEFDKCAFEIDRLIIELILRHPYCKNLTIFREMDSLWLPLVG